MAVYSLTIAGVPYTFEVSPYDIDWMWTIHATANGPWRFACQAWAPDPGSVPALDSEIVLSEDGVPIFGGTIQDLRLGGIQAHGTDYLVADLNCLDFNAVPSRRYAVSLTIPAGTLKAALQALVGFLDGVTLSGTQVDGPALPALTYSAWTVQQVLDQLGQLTGYVWTISATKVLSMHAPGSLAAPFNVDSSSVGTVTVGDVIVAPTRHQYANRVTVIGNGFTATAQNAGEITAHGTWELVVQAPDSDTQAAVDALAAAVLAASLPILKTVEYQTHELGIVPGQTQTINLSTRGVNNTFLVTDVKTQGRGSVAIRTVTAIEGLVYKPGWREQVRQWGGSGGGLVLPGVGGGGGGGTRYAYFLGSFGEGVRSATPTWVDATPLAVQLNTIVRGTTQAQITAQLRAFDPTVSVQARLFDVTAGTPCAGLSAVVTADTFQTATWVVTLNAGSHYYRLQLLPGAADADVAAIAYLE